MKYLILALTLLVSLPTFSRWAEPSEASYETIYEEYKYRIYKDYNFESTYTFKGKVLNDSGRDRLGTIRFNYQPASRILSIVDAWSDLNGKITNVPRSSIVNSPVTVAEGGYDERRQIVIPYSQVEVGTVVSYVLKSKSLIPLLGQFSSDLAFDRRLITSGSYTFDSDNKLFFDMNDPDGAMELKEEQKDSRYFYTLTIKKPIYRSVLEEDASYLPLSQIPSFTVSSAETYKDYFLATAKEWSEVLSSPLPNSLKSLVEAAKKISDPVEQINFVSSKLANQMRYMGDWRSVKGGYVPRSLEIIADTQYGDCKDYSIVLVKLYRELGFVSHPALVFRSKDMEEAPKRPTVTYFNHAIASVEIKGKIHWVDGTNFVSNVMGVPDDISDRQALILNPENVRLEFLDWGSPKDNYYATNRDTVKSSKNTIKEKVTYIFKGEMARKWAGQELLLSKIAIENQFKKSYTRSSNYISAKVQPFDFSSRSLSPLKLEIDLERYFTSARTTSGSAFIFSSIDYDSLMAIDGKTRVSAFNAGGAGTWHSELELKKFNIQGRNLKSCKAVHPAVEYIWNIDYLKGGDVKIVEDLITKKRYITPEELRAPEFIKFQKDMKACFGDKYLVYK
jgi:hypothetical protein